MSGWLERNAQAIQAACAVIMAGAALAAAVFVPWQIAANDRTNRDQAAREIYREFLNISIQQPSLATADYCTLPDPVARAAYESYLDYLLYTAEQVLELNAADWESTIAARLHPHLGHLCTFDAAELDTTSPAVAALVKKLTASCSAPCAERQP